MTCSRRLVGLAVLVIGASLGFPVMAQEALKPAIDHDTRPSRFKPDRRLHWILGDQPTGRLRSLGMKDSTPMTLRVPTVGDPPHWASLGPNTIVDGQIGLTGKAREVIGKVTAIKAHPDDARLWLAGTASGGIWRTADGGKTWDLGKLPAPPESSGLAVFDPIPLEIQAIAFGPGTLAYAATGDATRSLYDYGTTGLLVSDSVIESPRPRWRPLVVRVDGTSFDWRGVAISSILPVPETKGQHVVWIGTRIARSSESLIKPDERFIGLFRGTVSDAGAVILDLAKDAGIEGPVTDLKADPGHREPDCLFAAVLPSPSAPQEKPRGGVYRLCRSDESPRWRPVRELPPKHSPATNVKIAVAAADTLYASFTAEGGGSVVVRVFRLTKTPCEGKNCYAAGVEIAFDPVATVPDAEHGSRFSYCSWNPASPRPYEPRYCTYANVLSVQSSAPDVLYAGGVALWKCTDCGALGKTTKWTDISYTTPRPSEPIDSSGISKRYASPRYGIHVDQQAMDWASDGRLIVGNDGGVWSTTNSGGRWKNHNFDLTITQIWRGALDPGRPGVVFAGTQDVGTIRRDGWRWRWVQGGDGVGVAVSHRDPATHWATVHQSVLVDGDYLPAMWRTQDGGLTFQRADLGIERVPMRWVPPFVQCPDGDVLLFGTRSLWMVKELFKRPRNRAFEIASPPAWTRLWQGKYQASPAEDPEVGITAIAFAPDRKCTTYAFADTNGQVYMTDPDSGWQAKRIGSFGCGGTIGALAISPDRIPRLYAAISTFQDPDRSCKTPGYLYSKDLRGKGAADDWKDVTPTGWARTPPVRMRVDQRFQTLAIVPADKNVGRQETVLAGGEFGVWISFDIDAGWCHLALDTNTPHVKVMDLHVHPVTHGVYAFTFGRGVFRLANVKAAMDECGKALKKGP